MRSFLTYFKHQHHITDILYEMVHVINKKRKTSVNKPKNREEDQSTQNTDTDENLPLENDKAEL